MKPDNSERLGPEIPIKTTTVPMGLPGVNRRTVDGYVLATGTVLLESERDEQGRYCGGGRYRRDVSSDAASLYAGKK